MKKSLLKFITCPICNSSFELADSVQKDMEIISASLVCQSGHAFPVSGGVPRLLVQDKLEEAQRQVQDSYSEQWRRTSDFGYEPKTKEFRLNQFMQKFGWENLREVAEFLSAKRFILDAGTGLGWHVKLYAEQTKGEVFGVDISQSIDVAYQHIGHLPNVHLIQSDLTNLPFKEDFFEFIVSDGVLHHTPDTEASFKYLVPLIKTDGEIAIYIYKKKGPVREFCDDYIRTFTTGLSSEQCWKFSEAITRFGKSLSDMNAEILVPEDIEYLGIEAGKHNLQRFVYWNIFKCFWNDDFDFDTNVMVNFDWYHPQYAHRHTPTEMKQWFQDMRLEILNFDVGDSGISVRAKKCAV